MLPARHIAALVLLFVSLIGVLTVSYYQILDMDRLLVRESDCKEVCKFRFSERCLMCQKSEILASNFRFKRSPARRPGKHPGAELYEAALSKHKHYEKSFDQIVNQEKFNVHSSSVKQVDNDMKPNLGQDAHQRVNEQNQHKHPQQIHHHYPQQNRPQYPSQDDHQKSQEDVQEPSNLAQYQLPQQSRPQHSQQDFSSIQYEHFPQNRPQDKRQDSQSTQYQYSQQNRMKYSQQEEKENSQPTQYQHPQQNHLQYSQDEKQDSRPTQHQHSQQYLHDQQNLPNDDKQYVEKVSLHDHYQQYIQYVHQLPSQLKSSKTFDKNTLLQHPSLKNKQQCDQQTVCLVQCEDGLVNICSKEVNNDNNGDLKEEIDNLEPEPLCEEERPLVMGHAGGDTVNKCENTPQATVAGITAGMEAVHIDISVSKDMVPFLWRDHDPRSLSARLRQLGIYGTMGCRPALVPETLKPAHTLDFQSIQSSWFYLNTTSGLPGDHIISFKDWIEEVGPALKSLSSIWLEFRMPKQFLEPAIRKVWSESLSGSIEDKLFFRIQQNGKISFHHPITMVGGVDISVDKLSTSQWNSLVYILEEVQTADSNDNAFILNREDEVLYALLVEKITSKPTFLSEEIKSLLDPAHLNLNGINFEVKAMTDLVENIGEVIRSRDNVTRDTCQPKYTQVAAWTVNTIDVSNKLVCLRTDYIITDYPGRIERNIPCEIRAEEVESIPEEEPDCPRYCARIYEPVCGSDGVTHSNRCMLRLAECESGLPIRVLYSGKCRYTDPKARSASKLSSGSAAYVKNNQAHNNDEKVDPRSFDVSQMYKQSHRKESSHVEDDTVDILNDLDKKIVCDVSYCIGQEDYTPVCGEDNLTYDSVCHLAKTRCTSNPVELKHTGACNPDPCRNPCSHIENPVCASDRRSYMNLCTLYLSACLDLQDGGHLYLWHRGTCGDCNIVCTREFDPVCGSDGKSYPSQCVLESQSCSIGTPIWKVRDGLCRNSDVENDIRVIFGKTRKNSNS